MNELDRLKLEIKTGIDLQKSFQETAEYSERLFNYQFSSFLLKAKRKIQCFFHGHKWRFRHTGERHYCMRCLKKIDLDPGVPVDINGINHNK